MISNSLITAGWLFFAGWSAVLATLTAIAFGRDLRRLKGHIDPPPHNPSSDPTPRSTTH